MVKIVSPSILLILPLRASAHVKWFVDEIPETIQNMQQYTLGDAPVLLWLAIGIALVTLSLLLDTRLPDLAGNTQRYKPLLFALLRSLTGLSLILTAYANALIAPHFDAGFGLGMFLLFLEIAAGFLFILGLGVWIGAASLILLYIGVMIKFGPINALEYINMLGIGLFMLLLYLPSRKLRPKLRFLALPVLRILTGIALVTLALTEKLIVPQLGETFLSIYHWNFMGNMGLQYSDQLFVLSAGMIELVFGLILILGSTTRLNVLTISFFMFASNITFLIQGSMDEAIIEIIGHMPIIATALIYILYGNSSRQRNRLESPVTTS